VAGRLRFNQCYSANTHDRNAGCARPNQIWVYDFVAASSDSAWRGSSLAGQVGAPSTPPTPEEIEIGRKYGAMIRPGVGQRYSGYRHARD